MTITTGFLGTGTQSLEVKGDQDWGQTFVLGTQGSGSIAVSSLTLGLFRMSDASLQAITVTIRSSWDGSVLWSGEVSSSALSTSTSATYTFTNISGLNLQQGTSYVLQITSSSTAGKVYLNSSDQASAYTTGTLIDKDGISLNGDLLFSVSGTAPVVQTTTSPTTTSSTTTSPTTQTTTTTTTNFSLGEATGSTPYEVKADQNWGQSFVIEGSSGTMAVTSIGLGIFREEAASPQTITVELRSSWDGQVIWQGTISSSQLSTSSSGSWVFSNISGLVLQQGQNYVLRASSSSIDGKIFLTATSGEGSYLNGTLLDKMGVAQGSDLRFVIAGTLTTTTNSGGSGGSGISSEPTLSPPSARSAMCYRVGNSAARWCAPQRGRNLSALAPRPTASFCSTSALPEPTSRA